MALLPILLAINWWNAWLSLAIGFALNALLCYLAKRFSSADLKEYRRVVFYFCSLNTVCLVIQAFTMPISFIGNDGRTFVFLQGLAASLPQIGLRLATFCCYINSIMLLIISLGLQFLDRYLVVCRSISNAAHRYALIFSLKILFLLSSFLLGFYVLPMEDYQIDQIFHLDDGMVDKRGEEVGGELMANLKIASEATMQNEQTKFLFCIYGLSLVVCYLIVVICYVRIRAFLKQNLVDTNNGGSSRDNAIRQITLNMLFQAILPMYAMALYAVNIGFIIGSQYSPWLVQLQMLLFVPTNWLPLLNPLVTILTIRAYRLGLVNLCDFRQKTQTGTNIRKTSTQPPPPIVTTHNGRLSVVTIHSPVNY